MRLLESSLKVLDGVLFWAQRCFWRLEGRSGWRAALGRWALLRLNALLRPLLRALLVALRRFS